MDGALFERLAQALEHAAAELRQIIKKEYAAMSQAEFSRARDAAASDKRDIRAGVMWRTKWRVSNVAAAGRGQAGYGVNRRHGQRSFETEWRQQTRKPARQHRLAGTGRTAEEHVMSARRSDLERTPTRDLPPNIRQILTRHRQFRRHSRSNGRRRIR